MVRKIEEYIYYKRISITPLNICNVSDSIINGLMSSNKSVFSSILFYLNFHRQIIMLLIFVS